MEREQLGKRGPLPNTDMGITNALSKMLKAGLGTNSSSNPGGFGGLLSANRSSFVAGREGYRVLPLGVNIGNVNAGALADAQNVLLNVASGQRWGEYGLLPAEVAGMIPSEEDYGKGLTPMQAATLRSIWGGTLLPMGLKPGNAALLAIDNQYELVVKAIENQLGSRTDSNVWQGRLVTQKAIWDLWIDYVRLEMIGQLKEDLTRTSVGFAILPVKSDTTGYDGVISLASNIVDLSMYLKGNINLSDVDKITLCVRLDPIGADGNTVTLAGFDLAKEFGTRVIQSHPNYSGKLVYTLDKEVDKDGKEISNSSRTDTGAVYLKLRVFMKNSNEFRWRLSPKYGPFDVLYSKVGSYSKTYIDPSKLSLGVLKDSGATDAGLDSLYYGKILDELTKQMDLDTNAQGFIYTGGKFKFGTFALLSKVNLLESMAGIIGNSTFVTQGSYEKYLIYLKANQTLAKWFYGKKSALQKINLDRVTSYLRKDTQDLKKVMHFFGGDASFVDRRR